MVIVPFELWYLGMIAFVVVFVIAFAILSFILIRMGLRNRDKVAVFMGGLLVFLVVGLVFLCLCLIGVIGLGVPVIGLSGSL